MCACECVCVKCVCMCEVSQSHLATESVAIRMIGLVAWNRAL